MADSFMSGVNDFFGSILTNAGGIANVITATKGGGSNNTANLQYDAFGRLPGQPGYGTATPPATGVASSTSGWFASLSNGVKLAIFGGVAAVVVGAFFMFRKKR